MKKILRISLIAFCVVLLSGCATGIDPENPEKSVSFLQNHFGIETEAEETQIEMDSGIKDAYEVRNDISVILNEEKDIEQINLDNLDKEEAINLLEAIEFPVTESMKDFMDLDESEMEFPDIGQGYFTTYEGAGVQLFKKGYIMKNVTGPKDFRVILLYNEERFDDFKE